MHWPQGKDQPHRNVFVFDGLRNLGAGKCVNSRVMSHISAGTFDFFESEASVAQVRPVVAEFVIDDD